MFVVAFIIGSNFTGSTYLSHLLTRYGGYTSLGEAHRLKGFRAHEAYPQHYMTGCSICGTHDDYDCPVWRPDLLGEEPLPLADTYVRVLENCNNDRIVDSSKTAEWLATLMAAKTPILPRAMVLSRSPFRYIDSNAKRVPDYNDVLHVDGWKNQYVYALRVLAGFAIPHLVIRYDKLVQGERRTLDALGDFLGIDAWSEAPPDVYARLNHPLGGNTAEISRMPGFNIDRFTDNLTGQAAESLTFDDRRLLARAVETERDPARDAALIDRTAWSRQRIGSVLEVPGVIEICSLLGYRTAEFLD